MTTTVMINAPVRSACCRAIGGLAWLTLLSTPLGLRLFPYIAAGWRSEAEPSGSPDVHEIATPQPDNP